MPRMSLGSGSGRDLLQANLKSSLGMARAVRASIMPGP